MPDIRIDSKIDLRIELDHLTPLQGSLKELSVEAYEKLKKSILEYGFKFPIFIWRETKTVEARIMGGKPTTTVTNWILDGHGRRLVLLKLRGEGYAVPPLPCVEIEAGSLEQAKRDVLLISSQYQHMTGDGLYEFMSDAGITVDELDAYDLPHIDMDEFRQEFFEDTEEENGECGEDEVPDRPAETRVCNGDVWVMGNHRLLCGDSSRLEDVQLLMSDKQADMVFTDPPYGVSYVGKTKDALTIDNDQLDDVALEAFLTNAFRTFPIKDGGSIYVCSPPGNPETVFRLAWRGSELQLRQCLVWAKQQFVMGRQDYHWRHESILYGWKDGAAHYFIDDRTQDTVWDFDRPHRSTEHPTMKPVELVEKAVNNSSRRGEVVFDGFGGSGSTLIACEKLKRHCRLIEIDAGYCAVILSRWAKFTGQDPIRESDGVPWSSLA